jgi:hypothetical protein
MLKRIVLSLMLLLSLALLVQATALGQNRRVPDSQTRSPHGPLAIPCENCHTQTSWKPIRAVPEFNHNTTSYPLRGMHAKVDCVQCHTKPVFSNVSTHCSDCHADIHRSQFGANCEQCHSVVGWNVSLQTVRAHENRFPLIGAHAAVDCIACHKTGASGQFAGLSTECYSCHARDFQNAITPNHVSAGFSMNCQACHGVNTWFETNFDHNATGFPLTGAHASVPCTSCHVNNNYNLTATNTACSSCHMQDFQSTTNPNHVLGGFSTNCQTCHTTSSWTNATFNHALTGFPLTGAHVTVPCASCHVNNNYKLTNAACINCHQTDYQGTTNPSHVAAAFPTDCTVCHSTASWTGATFNHASTGFALTGSHVSVACSSCHVNNNYSLTSTACVTCHQTDYNNALTPVNHIQLGFPSTCEICHNTVAWSQGTFNHNNTPFPLTGAHVSVPCANCHVNNNYTSLPTACYGCHQVDYQGTNNPNHAAAGFPTTCQTCHTTTAWTGATFNHTWFSITHGNAQGVCATCHTNSSDYSVFQCTGCHGNNNSANFHHPSVGGYVYNSINCYSCHP